MSTWRKVCCCLAAIAGLSLGAQASAALPEGYTRLQYIQSVRSGSTRIVTNYTPQPNNDIIEAVFEPVVTNVTQAIWCARGKSATTSTFSLFLIGDKFRYDYGDGTTATGTPFGMAEPGAVYSVVASNNVVTVNGVVGQTFEPVTYTAGNPLMLFGRYHNVTSQNLGDYADIKLYSFKVWRKGELIHNFIPCTDANGAATLYDAGTSPCTIAKEGTFTAGNAYVGAFEVEEVPNQVRLTSAVTPEPVVKDPATHETLVKDQDYTLAYANNDTAGTATITITGKDGSAYAGKSETVYFNIYQRTKSVNATGSQYVSTGIVPGPTTAVEMHFNTTNCAKNTIFFGAGPWNQDKTYQFYQNAEHTDGYYYFRGGNTSLGVRCENGMDASISISTDAADNCRFQIGRLVTTKTVALTYTGSDPLCIFSGKGGANKSNFILYSFKMWKDGELVRDYIPVRGSNNVGLFDCVEAKLYVGSGTLIAGPDATDLVVAKIPNQFYAGAALEPSVVVSNFAGTALLEKDVDYTVSYDNNEATGTGKAIVTGIGAYKSVVTREFAIYPVAPPAPALGADAYVQHGLMNHWDGFDNVGTGAFDIGAKVWKDLKGGLDFALNDHAQWGEGFIETDGYSGIANGKTGQYLTLEIRHRSTKRRHGMPFLSGYGWNRVVWYGDQSDLWFHHKSNEVRNYLTGFTVPDTTDLNIAVVYGAASDAGDSPMLFYRNGARITSGIKNDKIQSTAFDWVTSFTNAKIGGDSETMYSYEGRISSIRLYSCPLTPQEIAYNAAVDKVRYDGVAPAEAFNSPDMRWNATSGEVEVRVDFSALKGAGTFSVNGGGASEWVPAGTEVTVVYTPAPGEEGLEWFGLPDGASRSGDLFTAVITAEAPIAAQLKMYTKIDVTRALNADPGCEEGAGYFNDGGNKTFMPVSWQRTGDRAYLGTLSTTSDRYGYHYLRPYQKGYNFYQTGLALPAGEYTLTFDHAAEATDHTISSWQLVDANNSTKSICAVTNEMRVFGTSWHTVQADFTVAEDGIYKLQVVFTANGANGNCFAHFDNISITSDTDLHIEVEKCYPYLGETQVRPPVVVRDNTGKVLTAGVDYELLYGANNSAGSGFGVNSTTYKHGNGYVAAKGLGTHYGVAGANFRLGAPIYVTPTGSSANDGSSWANAVDFATALSLAAARTANSEIWVAGSNVLASAAVQQIFYGNVMVRGGFAGTEAKIEDRAAGAHSFIDGDGQFSAVVFKDCCNVHFERLVFCGSPSRAVSKVGYSGSVFIDDCVFEGNGNAVYVQGIDKSPYDQGAVYATDSVFRNNSSTDDADGAAAIYSYFTRRVSAENTLFVSNTLATSSKVKASAILAKNSALELQECDFIGNIGEGATYGTVRASGSDATDKIANCLFLGNQTDGANAAAVTIEHASLATPAEVVNCTFAANANSVAGGCAGVKGTKGRVNVRNSIFYGNGVDFADHANSPLDVDYTLLADDTGATYSFVNGESKVGAAMVYGDPLFAAADDCHVLSEAGYFDATGGIHYAAEDVRSPAIDAGDPESDCSRETAPNGDCINLGRYGNTEQASRTPEALPEVDGPPQIAWNDPDGYSMPTVSFTMGGSGTYTAQGVIYISTDGGETWENVSGTTPLGGLVKGATREFVVPGYYEPGETIQVKVAVSGAGHDSVSEVAEDTVQGKLPPWHGKKGPENVIHVRPGAIGKGDGTSWSDAFASWADALKALSELKNEIWVAGTNEVVSAMETTAFTFEVTVRGGFRGWEESTEGRPEGFRSVIDGRNAFACFMFSNTKPMLVERMEFRHGGPRGMKKTGGDGDLTVVDCVFAENGATSDWGNSETGGNSNLCPSYGGCGAAFYGTSAAKLTVRNCRFEKNTTDSSRGSNYIGSGGGAFVRSFGLATIADCEFSENNAASNHRGSGVGAGLGAYGTRLIVTNCVFECNGSGEYVIGTTTMSASGPSRFVNCRFTGNGGSGVIRCVTYENSATATGVSNEFENCTFAYNAGTVVGEAYNANKPMDNKFHNCIFWGNTTDIALNKATYSVEVEWSLLKSTNVTVSAGSVSFGAGIITNDPQFVTTAEEAAAKKSGINVHLRGGLGYVDEKNPGKIETRYRFRGRSPAIDAGDPAMECVEPTPNGRRVNLGAYGNTPWATMSKGGTLIFVR